MSTSARDSTSTPRSPLPVNGYAQARVAPDFEHRLTEAIRPISMHYLAGGLHHLFDSGVFDELDHRNEAVPIPSLAATLGLDVHRLRGLLLFLANEGVTTVGNDAVALTTSGRQYGEFRAWYTMLIGGYGSTVQQIGSALPAGTPACSRDGRQVAVGSCEISRFDSLPIIRALLDRTGVDCREVVDLGCGNGLSLVQLCHELSGVTAWGAEPDHGGYKEAVELVNSEGLDDRIRLRNCSAIQFLDGPPEGCDPDLAVFSYVLQEILEQDGEEALTRLLRDLTNRFPRINIVVVEIANEIDNPQIMRHGLARNFWNPYYLLHYFTPQRLERQAFWESLFDLAGLQVEDLVTTDRALDSTGLEIGYLLRRRDV